MSTFDFVGAKIKHRSWQINMRGFLDGRESMPESQATSHQECELGKWLYSDGLKNFGTISEMKELEKVHVDLHTDVKRIIELKEAGNESEAEERYKKLKETSDKVISLLESIQVKVK